MAASSEFQFEILNHLKVLSERLQGSSKGWAKEVNIVSWNNRKARIDIREWDENHERMGKGITLTKEELIKFKELLLKLNIEELDVE